MSLSTRIQRIEVQAGKVAPVGSDLEGTPFTFPVPTDEQFIDWLDSERIPEYLEAANGGWAANERGWVPSKEVVETRVAWCHEMLALLQRAYEQGEIDADTYARLTTKQVYDRDHLRKLENNAHYFRPWNAMTFLPRSDGRAVSRWTLRKNEAGERMSIWLIGNQWVTFPDDVKPWELPGW